jgi:aminoacyl tRNA synthase complex-interacting multifunctional protein 1
VSVFAFKALTTHQQIDFGEETGPRTVVSGLVNYIPIDQMRDKYLIGVVRLG